MDRDALFDQVLRNPEDNELRQVFADLEEERGDREHARLIRVQLQLEEGTGDTKSLAAQEAELLAQHGARWAAPLRGLVDEFYFARGFVERVTLSLQRPAEDTRRVLEAAPILVLRDVEDFSDFGPLLQLLPELERIRGLELWRLYTFDPDQYQALALSPALAGLRSLLLRHHANGVFPSQRLLTNALHRFRAPRSIESLAIGTNGSHRGAGTRALRTLCLYDYPSLRHLNLACARINAEAAQGLLHRMPQLVALDLCSARFSIAAMKAFVQHPRLAQLERLRIAGAHVEPEAGASEYSGWEEALRARLGAALDMEKTPKDDDPNPQLWRGLTFDGAPGHRPWESLL